jgi:serine/threonine protein kinase
MPAPSTIDAFVEVLKKSELVEAERLQKFLQQANGLSTTPRKLAARLVAAGLITQFQAEQLLLGKYRGFTLGKYKVLERIGSGGHSSVYLCEHLMVKRRVAIKVLPTAKADNPTALARFYREARAAGSLDHPNLVKAHDIDQENGLHFLVMDYVNGPSLQEIVSRFGSLSVRRAAHCIRQAAQGLQAAHAAGLVHRDIKPANILLDRHGVIRILDLGLARFFSDSADPLTLKFDHNNVLGTADYVAPEQALNSHDVDIRADIYSLGATFYFLLAGQPLFPGGQITQKLIWHQTRQPTPIQQLRPEVPDELAAVIARMIDKDPCRRYQMPAVVIEALMPWTTVPVPPPTEMEMPRLSPAVRAAAVAEAESASDLAGADHPATSMNRSVVSLFLPKQPDCAPTAAAAPTARSRRPPTMTEMPTPPIEGGLIDTDIGPAALPAALATPVAADPQATSVKLATDSAPSRHPTSRFSKRRLLASSLLLLAGAISGVTVRWLLKSSAPKQEASAPAPATLRVSHSPEHFPSLAAALQAAPPGARIYICEPTWEEALQLTADGSAQHAVRIEGQSPTGSAVLWRPPRDHPADQPLVRISEAAGVTLKGFTLDGEDRVEVLISLAGPSAGLTLDDMHLRGFRRHGVACGWRWCRRWNAGESP